MIKRTIEEMFVGTLASRKSKRLFSYKNPEGEWTSVTYGEFYELSAKVGAHLKSIGVSKGDRVAIYSENRVEWCAVYIGTIFLGAVVVPIDSQLTEKEVPVLLLDSGSKVIFASPSTMPVLAASLDDPSIKPSPPIVINFDSAEFDKIRSSVLAFSHTAEIDEQDIAMLVYTSGTTGNPKAVMLTHYNLCSEALAVKSINIILEEDNILAMLPLHHTYALMGTFLAPIFLGGSITYPVSIKGPDVIGAIKENQATILVSVPRVLDAIKSRITERFNALPGALKWFLFKALNISMNLRGKYDVNIGKIIFGSVHKPFGKQLKYLVSGGARLEPETMRFMEALGFTVLEGYGLTETSPAVAFNPPQKRKPGSVGASLDGTIKIEIVNPNERGEGEVGIRGPMVMKGYYKNQEATNAVIKDGMFMTGDLGYIDSDGYLFLTGRSKEVIVLGTGKNIYPEEIEKLYGRIPLVKEICVFALNDRLQAVIVPDMEYAKQKNIGYINESLRWEVNIVSHKLPSHMRLMGFTLHQEPLPRTPLGKLRRFLIKDIVAGKAVALEEDRVLTADETGKRVVKCIEPLMAEQRKIQGRDNLELDLGLDSLKRVELIVSLEKEFSIKLPESIVSQAQTVSELVSMIKDVASGAGEGIARQGEGLDAILSSEPTEEEKAKVGSRAGVFERALVSVLWFKLRILAMLYFGLKVKGRENLPQSPFIIAANHASFIDGPCIGLGVSYSIFSKLYFQGYQKYFKGAIASKFARLAHVIPIDPDTHLNNALRVSAHILRQGGSLCIFPEGGRTFDGSLMEFKKGVGMLAVGMKVPVVPVYIDGTFEAYSRHMKTPKSGNVTVVIGRPIHANAIDFSKKPEGIDDYQYFSDVVKRAVQMLKDSRG